MIEIILSSGLIIYIILEKDKYKILYLLIFLLPFHSFIKSCFTFLYNGGEIFSFWKEVAVLILAYKVFKKKYLKINKTILILQIYFVCLILVYFLISGVSKNALPTLRDHLFPIIFFFTISVMYFDATILKKIVLTFSISLFISGIMGFLQHFLFNIPISFLMGAIDYIDANGYIQYKTTSFRISGFERMFGITTGPNIFGVFTAFGIVLLYGIILNKIKFNLSKLNIKFIWITLILSIICLVFSFSRAGWFIAIVGAFFLILFYSNWVTRLKYIFISVFFIIISFSVLTVFFPNESDIILSSLSGKELSAADRGNNVTNAYNIVLHEPWGHGLGTSDNRYNPKFFAESAFMNIAYEIGVLGLFYLIFLHSLILAITKRYSKYNFFSNISFAISISSLLACFASVNPYGMPYIYLWWFVLGLGINHSQIFIEKNVKYNKMIKE